MSITLSDLAGAAHLWATTTRMELSNLAREVRGLGDAFARRWRTDPKFRGLILRTLGHTLGAAALRGPRATVLWAASFIGHVLTVLAQFLDGSPVPAPAR